MARPTIEELRDRRLNTMSADERVEFDEALTAARLALEVGEKVRDAREAAGLTQRDLAARMSTSQAAVARLESGGTRATLTTLHRAAAALNMTITVNLAQPH
ncbi:MAG: helix-turn-helix transcriptional regulator [bacterium]|nr:helix-turn-helix transcriptional regulator [bacterium]MDE0353265.1 helix-turn-helix transcriptional regulator [bacterium]